MRWSGNKAECATGRGVSSDGKGAAAGQNSQEFCDGHLHWMDDIFLDDIFMDDIFMDFCSLFFCVCFCCFFCQMSCDSLIHFSYSSAKKVMHTRIYFKRMFIYQD